MQIILFSKIILSSSYIQLFFSHQTFLMEGCYYFSFLTIESFSECGIFLWKLFAFCFQSQNSSVNLKIFIERYLLERIYFFVSELRLWFELNYCISANSFRGNYSFFNLTLCTVTFDHSTYRFGNYSREETIQGRKLFVEIRYLQYLGMYKDFIKEPSGDFST